ncbi:hypothetical protein EVAR_38997_1 [Eumeta japonica]|uniref:YqaJ viral recombinase domain-containing protein n=1 Tax=Eumeta variegata TaxID=151549 RepID=A0A4C1WRS9_EUMVA|nr:hypothetical protein EVAR_38997_1 [Eumeta japonica]
MDEALEGSESSGANLHTLKMVEEARPCGQTGRYITYIIVKAVLAEQEDINIEQCGLFIDKDLPFLGASPDGVAGDTIIELKCPITASKLGLEEAVKKKSQLLENKRKRILANENTSLVLPGAGPTSQRFYIECMLPQIVDPRFTRNMPIREPSAIRTTDEAINADDISNATNAFDAITADEITTADDNNDILMISGITE